MMTPEDNELLTRIGPGTKMGELLRRYWHPIAASDEMTPRPTKAVRILGESLVLFRDALGNFGLIGDRCPHRRAAVTDSPGCVLHDAASRRSCASGFR